MLSAVTRAAGVKEVIMTIALQSTALTGLINSWLSEIYVICDGQEEWMDRVLVDFLPGEKKDQFFQGDCSLRQFWSICAGPEFVPGKI